MLRELSMNALFLRDFTMKSLYISEVHFKYTICFAISLLIHYLFRLFTINCFVNSLYIKNYFSGLARINYCFRDSTLNSLSILRTQFEYAPFIANLLRIMTHSRNHDGIFTLYTETLRKRQNYHVTNRNHYVIISS